MEEYIDPSAEQLEALAQSMPSFEIAQMDEQLDPEQGDDDDLDFRLFAIGKAEKISIAEPAVEVFEAPTRDMSYYEQGEDATRVEQCKLIAIDGLDVLAQSKIPWLGCLKSNRVTHIPFAGQEKKAKRWRPSKQRRDKFKMMKAEKEIQEKQRQANRSARGRSGRGRGASRGSKSAVAGVARVSAGYPRKGA